jgi:hypothetical protein
VSEPWARRRLISGSAKALQASLQARQLIQNMEAIPFGIQSGKHLEKESQVVANRRDFPEQLQPFRAKKRSLCRGILDYPSRMSSIAIGGSRHRQGDKPCS